jgi:hypothetical protein
MPPEARLSVPYFARDGAAGERAAPEVEAQVVEVSLLLPREYVLALEERAHGQGLTAGQLLRRLVQELLRRLP